MRARIVLACAEPGAADTKVAAALGVSRPTVTCWRRRFAQAGLAGLADAQRCGRPRAELELTGTERTQLSRWAQQGRTGQALALRARIVLACASGAGNRETAARLAVSEATVARWRSRFLAGRLDGLANRHRPGRPPSIPAQMTAQVITATLGRPPGHAARWSRALMARQTGLSAATIGRIWSRSGLRPHLADDPATTAEPPGKASSQATWSRKEFISSISDAKGYGGYRSEGAATSALASEPAGRSEALAGGGLLAAERRDLLLARLRRDGRLVARELAAELGLSDDSVRRDLRDLAAAGLCQRVYGGALPASPILSTTYDERSRIALDSKRRVAAAAARLITPGSTVILDGGSTALEVVMALPPGLEATIVTPSPRTAVALASHPNVTVHTLSGQLHKSTITSVSVTAAEAAVAVTADLALLTVAGIHPQRGLTIGDREDAAMKRILIGRAAAVYVMASTEKLGTVTACKVAALSEVTGIIADIDHPTARQLHAQGAAILPAG